MSVDHYVFGLKAPLGRRSTVAEHDLRPLGPLVDLSVRLVQSGLVEGGVSSLRMGDVELSLVGDPVRFVHARGCAPWELLPLLDAMADGGAVAIFDPQRDVWHDPGHLRVGAPTPTRAPVSTPTLTGAFNGDWAERWSVRFTGDHPVRPTSVLGPNSVAMADEADVWCLDVGDGRPRWAVRVGRSPEITFTDGLLIAACADGRVLGLREDSGGLEWQTDVGHRALSVAASDRVIAVGTTRALVFLDQGSGAELARHDFGGAVRDLSVDARGVLACVPSGATWVPLPSVGRGGLRVLSTPAHVTAGYLMGASRAGEHVLLRSKDQLLVCDRRLELEHTVRLDRLGRPVVGPGPGALRVPAVWYLSLADHVSSKEHRTAVGLVQVDGRIVWERECPFPGGGPIVLPDGRILALVCGEAPRSFRVVVVDVDGGRVVRESGDLSPPEADRLTAGPSLSVQAARVLLSWGRHWTLFSLPPRTIA